MGTQRAKSGRIMICSVVGCDAVGVTSAKKAKETGLPRMCRGMCNAHYIAWRTHGDPLLRRHRDRRGADNFNWRGGDIAYAGAHSRVRTARGRASTYDCVSCGQRAQQWAYNGCDPDQLFGPIGKTTFFAFYSTNADFYDPLCCKCHRSRDAELAQRELREYREWRHGTGLTLADVTPQTGDRGALQPV